MPRIYADLRGFKFLELIFLGLICEIRANPQPKFSVQRSRDVLVYDEPLAVLIFEDHGPAKIAHLDFA